MDNSFEILKKFLDFHRICVICGQWLAIRLLKEAAHMIKELARQPASPASWASEPSTWRAKAVKRPSSLAGQTEH